MNFWEVIMRMPVMVIMANTDTVAPPMTLWGMVVRTEENLGTRPATSSTAAARADQAVNHLVDGDDAHVLAVSGGGQAPHEGAQNADNPLADDAAGQLPVGGQTVHAAQGGGAQVAHGLHGVDYVDDGQRDAG